MDSNKPVVSEQSNILVSIEDAAPDDLGGVYARQGFTYQDDIAAHYLIEMLTSPRLVEVRCETNEDITNIWCDNGERIAEFVQVKAEHPNQLWTASKFTERKKSPKNPSGIGTSILEKNLSWDKYKEPSKFGIVTCRQVSKELEFLTYALESDIRKDKKKQKKIHDALKEKVGCIKSDKGNSLDYWICNSRWSVFDERQVIKSNKAMLFENLNSLGIETNSEKIREIYDALKSLAKEKAELGVEYWNNKKVMKQEVIDFVKNLNDPYPNSNKSQRLKEKIIEVGMDDTCYEVAKEQQRYYLMKKRTSQYFSTEESSSIDMDVLTILHKLRSSLDCGEIQESPIEFHNRCLISVNDFGKKHSENIKSLSDAYFSGCMYETTSRCMHRFKKATK